MIALLTTSLFLQSLCARIAKGVKSDVRARVVLRIGPFLHSSQVWVVLRLDYTIQRMNHYIFSGKVLTKENPRYP